MIHKTSADKSVLVGVLKSKSDLNILLKERWYRIPVSRLAKRRFDYIAFYQPVSFGKKGKSIEYYGRVSRKKRAKRITLLPKEIAHPRARNSYFKFKFSKIFKLPRALRNNISHRRVSFGFTTLKLLRTAKNILELYGVPQTERIIEKALKRVGIRTFREYTISRNGKRFRIDLAVFTESGRIAVECDNRKAHRGKIQKRKDRAKDRFLGSLGWKVIRLREGDILEKTDKCIQTIQKHIS